MSLSLLVSHWRRLLPAVLVGLILCLGAALFVLDSSPSPPVEESSAPPTPAPPVDAAPPAVETPQANAETPQTFLNILAGILDKPEAAQYPSAPFWELVEDERMYKKFQGYLDRDPDARARWQAEWDEAQRESLEESLRHLHDENLNWFGHALMLSPSLRELDDYIELLAVNAVEPRTLKLLAIAENGSSAEKQVLSDTLTQFCQAYADRKEAEILDPVPILAAQLDPDGSTLSTLVAAAERRLDDWDRNQQLREEHERKNGLPVSARIPPTHGSKGVAYAGKTLLDRFLREPELRQGLNPAQLALLRQYEHFTEDNGLTGPEDFNLDAVMPLIDYARRLQELADPAS